MDLSFLQGLSVNDDIDPTLCSMAYVSIDEVTDLINSLGTDAMMAKVDIESAYHRIPVHPHVQAMIKFTSIPCFYSACIRHPNFSMRCQTHSVGFSTRSGCTLATITWMTLLLLAPQSQQNVRKS